MVFGADWDSEELRRNPPPPPRSYTVEELRTIAENTKVPASEDVEAAIEFMADQLAYKP